jgi:hypothetical protein
MPHILTKKSKQRSSLSLKQQIATPQHQQQQNQVKDPAN